jgi:hypothetical protein
MRTCRLVKLRVPFRRNWLELSLILLAAFCFLDDLKVRDVVGTPSQLVLLGLSFPVGWATCWLAVLVTTGFGLRETALGDSMVFLASAAGATVNICLWAAFLRCCYRSFISQETADPCGQAEFQQLLDEHRRQSAEPASLPNAGPTPGAQRPQNSFSQPSTSVKSHTHLKS